MALPRLSAIIITRNEKRDLPGCLESLKGVADEVVVVDDMSSDGTPEIASKYGCKVYQHALESYAAQKQFALERASGRWALNLDADERLSGGLREEILSEIGKEDSPFNGFLIPYEVEFLGRRLRFGGLGNERHLRFFKRTEAQFEGGLLHEGVKVPPPVGNLKGKIVHIPYESLEEYLDKLNQYTSLAACKAKQQGRKFHWYHHAILPLEFAKRYFLQLGFIDGAPGLIWCSLCAFYSWTKYMKLREL